MPKFSVGDRVRVIKKGSSSASSEYFGRWGNITESEPTYCCLDIEKESGGFHLNEISKEGIMPSKYDELKSRIENVEAWDKEADDILQNFKSHNYFILISATCLESSYNYVKVFTAYHHANQEAVTFNFSTQCEKLSAFKKALMWLLDNSDIPKDDKKAKRDAKIDDLQRQLDELRKEKVELNTYGY